MARFSTEHQAFAFLNTLSKELERLSTIHSRKTELYSWILKTIRKFKEAVQISGFKTNRLKTLYKNVML